VATLLFFPESAARDAQLGGTARVYRRREAPRAGGCPAVKRPAAGRYLRQPLTQPSPARRPSAASTAVAGASAAAILHLPGFDHERLTFRRAGRDYRLNDVMGRVVRKVLA
jgi:hypothetical protein